MKGDGASDERCAGAASILVEPAGSTSRGLESWHPQVKEQPTRLHPLPNRRISESGSMVWQIGASSLACMAGGGGPVGTALPDRDCEGGACWDVQSLKLRTSGGAGGEWLTYGLLIGSAWM